VEADPDRWTIDLPVVAAVLVEALAVWITRRGPNSAVDPARRPTSPMRMEDDAMDTIFISRDIAVTRLLWSCTVRVARLRFCW
jgi:hypothetical protein